MEHEEITHKIIGAAYKVLNSLGFGLLINFGPSGVEVKRKYKSHLLEA